MDVRRVVGIALIVAGVLLFMSALWGLFKIMRFFSYGGPPASFYVWWLVERLVNGLQILGGVLLVRSSGGSEIPVVASPDSLTSEPLG